MQDVAIYKAIHGLPIEDLKREEIVLKKSSLASENYGLNVDSMKSFTVALMSSAKAIQYRYRADMLSKSVDTNAARDLKSEIRPALIKLGSELNMSISEYLGSGNVFS
ncbi:chorismate mutase, partial [Vibrio splendidus]|uniref:chorismate mutase n=1 Tax=Vibrio splendidus TaxID=29497 RepID=UPI0032200621